MGGFFWEEFFERIFLRIFLEDFLTDFFWRIIGRIIGRIILGGFSKEKFLGRNSLFTLELTCFSRFCFFSRFWVNGEEGSKENFQSLGVRLQAHRT